MTTTTYLLFCTVPTYLRVKLDRYLMFSYHIDALCKTKKLKSHVTLLKRLAGSGWGADSKTSKYCAPVWCHSFHNLLIDSVLNAMCIISGCLHPMPVDYLPILAGIQPAELHQHRATLSLAYCTLMDSKHLLH